MKTLWIATLLALHLQAFEYGLTPSQVSEKIYCFFGAPEGMNKHNNGNMVNSCFVDMETSWLVIDSGPSYSYAKECVKLMTAIKKQPIDYLINTHVHDDHWLGNGYYKQIGATIVGSKAFETSVNPDETPRMQTRITPQAYEGTEVTLPTQLIDEDLTLKIGNQSVQVKYLEKQTHSHGDLIVHIPALKSLFAGDLVFTDRIPSARDGDISQWLKQLQSIEAQKLDHIIGGHGNITGKDATAMTRNYLTALKEAIQASIEEGEEIDEAVEKIKLEAFKSRPMYDDLHKQNVETGYRALEWADE